MKSSEELKLGTLADQITDLTNEVNELRATVLRLLKLLEDTK